MKKLLLCLIFFSSYAFAQTAVINLYMASNYLANSIVEQFEKETGIHINLTEFDSNETMFAKLKTFPDAGYDVVLPSNYMIKKMRRENMLSKIDKKLLPNFKHLDPKLLHKAFDRNNNYSIPFLWGATGIAFNTQHHSKKNITNWSNLWQPEFKNQLIILDDLRDAFNMALISLGYSINDTNPKHIKAAYEKLKQLLPNIKLFNSDANSNIFIDEDVTIGMAWNGDINVARKENSNLEFIYPKDGFAVWIDCLAITKNAPHRENAHKLINFLLRPDIAKKIALQTGYSSPNLTAIKMLPKKLQNDPIAYPSATILKRAQFQDDVGATIRLYTRYWEMVKYQSGRSYLDFSAQ